MSSVRILVIGGYGALGTELLPHILASIKGSRVIIAGRSFEKAQALSSIINETYLDRATAVRIDAGNIQSLEQAPPFDVLLNLLAPIISNKPGCIQVMKFAVGRDAAYLDTDASVPYQAGLPEQVQREVGTVAPVVLFGAGCSPGFYAPLARLAAAGVPKCKEVHVSGCVTLPGSLADEILLHTKYVKSKIYSGGRWHEVGLCSREYVENIDFGDGRLLAATPLWATEIEPIVSELNLERCSIRAAPDMNSSEMMKFAVPLICAPCCPCVQGVCKGWLRSALDTSYARNPTRCIFQAKAISADAQALIRIVAPKGEHPFTASCVIATLEQVIDGTVCGNAPPRTAGLAVDPAKMLESLRRQGAVITYT